MDKVNHSDIRMTKELNFNLSYGDPIVIKSWLEKGLPPDSMSIENAIILDLSIY